MRSGNLTDFWCTIGGCTKSKHTSQVLVQGPPPHKRKGGTDEAHHVIGDRDGDDGDGERPCERDELEEARDESEHERVRHAEQHEADGADGHRGRDQPVAAS